LRAQTASPTIPIDVAPLAEPGGDALRRGAHAVLGISPFNSYFTEERIRSLAAWAVEHFERVHLFIPDEPTRFTLEALGYNPQRAQQKARTQCNWLRNKIQRALLSLDIDEERADEMVVGWAELQRRPSFVERHAEYLGRFEADPDFRQACLEGAAWALEGKGEGILSEEALHLASRYFLAEIPLFLDSPGVFGVVSSAFCYHQVIPFMDQLYDGVLTVRPAPGQGFVRVEARTAFAPPSAP